MPFSRTSGRRNAFCSMVDKASEMLWTIVVPVLLRRRLDTAGRGSAIVRSGGNRMNVSACCCVVWRISSGPIGCAEHSSGGRPDDGTLCPI